MAEPSNPTILIVDDDQAHGASVRDLLNAHEYAASCTTENTTVLAQIEAHDYQVLILDLNMPKVTGVDILEQLVDTGSEIKTIVLSGEQSLPAVTPILRLGAFDYLAKPYEPQQLLTSVSNALGKATLELQAMPLWHRHRSLPVVLG